MIFPDSRHSLTHLVRQDPVYKLAGKYATHNKGDASHVLWTAPFFGTSY